MNVRKQVLAPLLSASKKATRCFILLHIFGPKFDSRLPANVRVPNRSPTHNSDYTSCCIPESHLVALVRALRITRLHK